MIRCQHQNAVESRRWIAGAMVAAGIALGCIAMPGPASAIPTYTPISSCGYTISKPGLYRVTGDLSSLQAPGKPCIDITASGSVTNPVLLEFVNTNQTGDPCESTTIMGDKTSNSPVGILIEASASSVFINGGNSNVAGWQTGIENDSNGATIENINASNNLGVGVLVNGTTGSYVSNMFSGILQDSKGASCFPTPIAGPQQYGIEFAGAQDSELFLATLSGNAIYGSWFDQTSTSDIAFTQAGPGTGGTTVGSFFFGCDDKGNITTQCAQSGQDNFVYANRTSITLDSGTVIPGGATYGIALMTGEDGYIVADDEATQNNIDIYSGSDLYNFCSSNTFFFNQADNVFPPCILDID